MVDADFKEPDDGGLSPKKGGLKTIIIIVVIAVVMGIGGFFAGKMLTGGGDQQTNQVQAGDAQSGGEETGAKTGGAAVKGSAEENSSSSSEGTDGETAAENRKSGFLALDTFTVNLNDPFGRRYVECDLNLVLDDRSLVPKIKENQLVMAKMRHEIFMTISAKSYSDLKSTAGKITLFEEVQMRVNEILKEEIGVEPVIEVLQTKFLMQ